MLKGLDLSGKNVIVTGGHVGLGLETTRALSEAGASVTVGSRDPDRVALALSGLERVQPAQLDLLDPPRSTPSPPATSPPAARSTS
ncbi:SDR family NAD(P)-dependent oxidoreductase [Nonomuraea rubra]|uniref:SDR family NAD(P)-dependent oxidoreductase n=1 Tax=Nonomuraea rubra TaxID=46180 RepID=UPI0033E8CCF5